MVKFMVWIAFFAVSILCCVILFVRKIISEDGRIKAFFRVYLCSKQKYPEQPERFHLEQVALHHFHPRTGKRWGDMGYSGKKYIDSVFEDKDIDIKYLIQHFISLEFPDKYTTSTNWETFLQENRMGEVSPEKNLKIKIDEAYNQYVAPFL